MALGYESTKQVTLEEMMHHSRAVSRGCKTALIVGDLPFGSYEEGPQQAINNAIKFMKMGAVEAVKLEGINLVMNEAEWKWLILSVD